MNVILCTKSLLPILLSLDPSVVYASYLFRYHQVFPILWLLGCFPTFFSSYYIPFLTFISIFLPRPFTSGSIGAFSLTFPCLLAVYSSLFGVRLILPLQSDYLQNCLCVSIFSLFYCILVHSQILFRSHHSQLVIVSHSSNWCSDCLFASICIKSLQSQSLSFHFLTQSLCYIDIYPISKYF